MHFCARKSIAMASSGRIANGTLLDCWHGKPFQAGGCSRWPHADKGTLELFGRIDDSSVARVEICQMRRDKWGRGDARLCLSDTMRLPRGRADRRWRAAVFPRHLSVGRKAAQRREVWTALCSRPTTPRANARQNMRSRISAIGRKEKNAQKKGRFLLGNVLFLLFTVILQKRTF